MGIGQVRVRGGQEEEKMNSNNEIIFPERYRFVIEFILGRSSSVCLRRAENIPSTSFGMCLCMAHERDTI